MTPGQRGHRHQAGPWPHQTTCASAPLELPTWEAPSATSNLTSKDSVSSLPPVNAFHAIVHRACRKRFKVCAVKIWVWARLTAKRQELSSAALPAALQSQRFTNHLQLPPRPPTPRCKDQLLQSRDSRFIQEQASASQPSAPGREDAADFKSYRQARRC